MPIWEYGYDNSGKDIKMSERRKYRRAPLVVSLISAQRFDAKTHNIGEGGMCFVSNSPFRKGTYHSFQFMLPAGKPILAAGSVVWCVKERERKYIIGVEFWNLDDYSRERIHSYALAKTAGRIGMSALVEASLLF